MMTIGSVSRATGIPTNTLRTWERRYGFPQPERTDGGQRVYSRTVVPHLVLVREAIAAGHRPRQLLTLTLDDLRDLIGSSTPRPQHTEPGVPSVPEVWKTAVFGLDGAALDFALRQERSHRGTLRFLVDCIGPFVHWLGDTWAAGDIAIYHEHFASGRVRAVLDETWRSLAPSGRATVVCATISGEPHDLGVHMAAVAVAAGGKRPLVLPGETPLSEIVSAVKSSGASRVAISLSAHSNSPVHHEQIHALRAALPVACEIWVGGQGAPEPSDGIRIVSDLTKLSE